MNELIKVDADAQVVSARELHEALGVEKRFSAWFETNSQGFVEGEDFTGAYLKVQSNQYGGEKDLVGDLAKLICQNGYQIGQKRLFDWLRNNGYLVKSGSSYNMPMQRYVEQGLFEVKESNVQNPDGSVRTTRTTKVTGKGQVYFVNKFLGRGE